jgi:uncharacterized protein (TIGR04552 family)
MRRDVLELDLIAPRPHALRITLQDLEAVRLVLAGESVVDWQRLAFRTLAEVDQFLATHLVDAADPVDRERLRYVFNEAVSFLEEHLKLKFPAELRDPPDVRHVFLWASQWGGFRRTQILSCVVLKLMHIIHHMEAADLKFKLPLAEEKLLGTAHRRILDQARELQEDGVPIVAFYGSRKSRSSIITKLLAKREAVAATIFDKLRYRVVVDRREDLAPTLARLAREMFPFNYVVPGQTHNNLVSIEDLAVHLSEAERAEAQERGQLVPPAQAPKNEFSGASYRSINWIADYPVRVADPHTGTFLFETGRVVYVNVEFQLLDQETARRNELGENAHSLYKARQYRRVAARLKRGAEARRE